MEYTPSSLSNYRLTQASVGVLSHLQVPTLVRKLRLVDFSTDGHWLILHVAGSSLPLVIAENRSMVFGTETISALDYFKFVIEKNDLIDVVAHPVANGLIPIDLFWIHIQYVGEPSDTGNFSKKEDGLFALRAKAGEKAERVVARTLKDKHGHVFDAKVFDSPGYFEIRYVDKKQRRPDLKCLKCDVTFEVKKRNRDWKFRVSHSEGRNFHSENSQRGWHAFVFPDMKPRFLSNSSIATAIANGDFDAGSDRYDTWADVRGKEIRNTTPPDCI